MRQRIAKGEKFGDWTLKKRLGEGGNGFVWLALNSASMEGAIKILAKMDGKNKEKMYSRFRNEVSVVCANSDIEGLLPVLDSFLPDDLTNTLPWYVMPVAKPLYEFLDEYQGEKKIDVAIRATLDIGKTLIQLHARGISHRDITPRNILVKNDRFFLADFGLVDYPDKADLTNTGEQIGAKTTISPEMKWNSQKADGKPHDVYSFAKTLWILLTGRRNSFEGQYDANSVNGLANCGLNERASHDWTLVDAAPTAYTRPLDDLLRASTNDDPSQRPTIDAFVEALRSWIETYKNFHKRNPLQWRDVQTQLFPTVVPQRAIWENIDDIVQVLDSLGCINSLNYMFLPGGGGMDLIGAKAGLEPHTVELLIDTGLAYVVDPKRLLFESFGSDSEWNYFRLETNPLQPTGIGHVYDKHENLREIAPLRYVSQEEWDRDFETDESYPIDSRTIRRFLYGDFVIFQKTSIYNKSSYSTDGRHSQMSTDEFRDYINGKVTLAREIVHDPQVELIARQRTFKKDDLVFAVLDKTFRQEYLQRFSRDSRQ